jgi:hypothetical protein
MPARFNYAALATRAHGQKTEWMKLGDAIPLRRRSFQQGFTILVESCHRGNRPLWPLPGEGGGPSGSLKVGKVGDGDQAKVTLLTLTNGVVFRSSASTAVLPWGENPNWSLAFSCTLHVCASTRDACQELPAWSPCPRRREVVMSQAGISTYRPGNRNVESCLRCLLVQRSPVGSPPWKLNGCLLPVKSPYSLVREKSREFQVRLSVAGTTIISNGCDST